MNHKTFPTPRPAYGRRLTPDPRLDKTSQLSFAELVTRFLFLKTWTKTLCDKGQSVLTLDVKFRSLQIRAGALTLSLVWNEYSEEARRNERIKQIRNRDEDQMTERWRGWLICWVSGSWLWESGSLDDLNLPFVSLLQTFLTLSYLE